MMDGLEERGQVVVIGATNRLDAIDPALRRAGRFDREIEIGVPDAPDRLEILQIHSRGMPLENVDLVRISATTHGFVGADLSGLCKEAAMKALRRYLPDIDLDKEIPREFLEKMRVYGDDFTAALKEVQPSAMREIFIEATNTRWSDVGGLDEARQEIIEAIEWPLRNPKRFTEMGIKPPKGIVLYGPPGTGKTLLARAVAGESEANFVNIRGPELLSKWVGESEKAVRETFRKARQVSPSIIFFDELDALAPARGGGDDGSRVSERVVNQILTELDGLVELEGVVVIGASNRPDIIDPALMRPGRFDRLVYVGAPSKEGRVGIFKIHARNMPLAADVDLNQMADMTDNYVGSDIEAVCREAAMLAMRENFDAKEVSAKHFHEAIKKVKPTMNDMVTNYYKAIKDHFKGGTPKDVQKAFLTPEYL